MNAAGMLKGPAGIETMFDGISYQKGAAILRMLRAYLSRDTSPQPLLRRRRLLQVRLVHGPCDWAMGLGGRAIRGYCMATL